MVRRRLRIAGAVAGLAVTLPSTAVGAAAATTAVEKAANPARWRNHGGMILRHTRVYPIFWGAQWNSDSLAPARAHELAFVQALNRDGVTSVLRQYGDSNGPGTGDVQLGGTWTDTQRPPAVVTGAAVQAEVARAIAQNGWPRQATAAAQPVYMVLPARSETAPPNCGYHGWDSGGGRDYGYILVRFPTWVCTSFPNAGDLLTATSYHEIAETVTDPTIQEWNNSGVTGGLWPRFEGGAEIADVCTGYPRVDGFVLQRIWDQSRGVCGV